MGNFIPRAGEPDVLATIFVSSVSIICSSILIASFLRLRYESSYSSSNAKACDASQRSSGPLAKLVMCKVCCDLVVALKFFLCSLAGAVPADSFWCYLEYFVGQQIALMSCSFNFLICLALYLIFKRASYTPMLEIESIVSVRNQLLVIFFCVTMTIIPLLFNQTGPVGTGGNNCWIKDSDPDKTQGHNMFRLTFFIPVLFANAFAILLLVLVYRRRRLFVSENR